MTNKQTILAVVRVSLRCRSVCWVSNINAIMYLVQVLTKVPLTYEFTINSEAKRVSGIQITKDIIDYRNRNILMVNKYPSASSYYLTRINGWQAVRKIPNCYDDEISWLLNILMNKRRKDILNFAIAVYQMLSDYRNQKKMTYDTLRRKAKSLNLKTYETVLLFNEAKQAIGRLEKPREGIYLNDE